MQFVPTITAGENGIRPCIIIILTIERRGPSVVDRRTLHFAPCILLEDHASLAEGAEFKRPIEVYFCLLVSHATQRV